MRLPHSLLGLTAIIFLSIDAGAAPVPLFDGKTFNGWEGDKETVWHIEDGALRAGSLTQKQEKNNFLATVKEYGNFELTLKWKLEGTEGFVNGGVQFHSKRVPNHWEVSGYQADLGAGYDGALYDESRRNKVLVQPTKDLLEKARKPVGEWNDYKIRAEGRHLQIWLNGVQTVDYTEPDAAIPLKGIIAVQIHGDATSVVRYKDLMIEELAAAKPTEVAGKPMALFDGKSLDGWTGTEKARWRVEDGTITFGGTGTVPPVENWLASTREFANFDLTFQAKEDGTVGTGMFFRSVVVPGQWIIGWQIDVGQSYDGGLFRAGPNSGKIAYPDKGLVERTIKPGEWNRYRVRAEGRHLQTWLNGVVMADYQDRAKDWRRSGVLALEMSNYGTGQAQFKDLQITELPATEEAAALAEGPASRITDQLPPSRKLLPYGDRKFTLEKEEVVVFVGSENMVLEQRSGWLEAALATQWKSVNPRFRHMSWEGDSVFRQNRMMEWGSWPTNLEAAGATAVVAWFGQVEAMDATKSVEDFAKAYGTLLDEFAKRTPRIVIVSPPLFEKPVDPRVPDNTKLNDRVRQLSIAAGKLASERGLVFVDLTSLDRGGKPLTRDGLHFSEAGLAVVGKAVVAALGVKSEASEPLRLAIVEKNRLWFDTWRCMNWAFAFGDRTTQPFAKGAGEEPAFVEELKKHQPLLAQAEATVFALANGTPRPESTVTTPPRADPPALTPAEEMANFKLRDGFAVNLFADESLGVIRPIQIRWDTRGRLWVACTPAYPQLQPGEHAHDYILILEDTDGDGKADQSSRYAEHLTMPMGFEFAAQEAGGGLYVCESTQLVHLPDRNGDDKADGHEIVLSGFGTGDTHQDANSLRWGPDGCLWFTQGYHIWSYVETPYGLAELNRSGVWRFNPRTLRLDSFLNESTAGLNCWGTAWDDYGQIFHGSGADTQIWFTTPAIIPTLHVLALPTGMAGSRGKSMEPEFLSSSHLPDDFQGVLLKSTYYTSQVQLYRLHDAGSGFSSEEMGDLMSGSNEFRPVETRVGPDGALYVCDWLNPVIGHYQASYRDPRRDRSHGRIWRVTAKDRPLVPKPALGEMSAEQLIGRLTSKERWERDAAKFTLFRMAAAKVIPAAQAAVLPKGGPDELRLLYELSGVLAAHEVASAPIIERLLASDDFRYRAWAIRLVGVWASQLDDPLSLLRKAMQDAHPRVRLEAIVACAWMPPAFGAEAVKVATLAMDQPMDAPLNYSLTQCIHALAPHWKAALDQGKLDFADRFHALAKLLTTVGDQSITKRVRDLLAAGNLAANARDSLLAVLIEYGTPQDADFAIEQAPDSAAVMDALVARAWQQPESNYGGGLTRLLDSPHRAAHLAACRMVAASGKDWGTAAKITKLMANTNATPEERAAAIFAVAKMRGRDALPELLVFADATDPTLRTAALTACAPFDPAAVASRCAQLLGQATAAADIAPLLTPMLNQKNGATVLAQALTSNKPSAEAAKLALQWMGQVGRDDAPLRKALNAAAGITSMTPDYSEALVKQLVLAVTSKGDSKAGATLFKAAQTTCMACHKLGQEGGILGPDLTAIGRAMTPEMIVESVLWPKRQVKEGFMLTQITTKSGETHQGYKANETPTTVTLKDVTGAPMQPISKASISTRSDTGTLMPEGLTAWMNEQQQLDLLRFLFQLGKE